MPTRTARVLPGASGSIRIIAAAIALVGLLALPILNRPPMQIEARSAASPAWLTEFNAWRSNVGVPTLSENATWSAGDYAHALYMVKNDLVTHYETSGVPYYTAGGDTAARNSNIYVSSSTSTTDDQAIDWWMRAPFHAMGMMDPRLTTTGFGSYRESKSGWDMGAAVDVLRGNSFSGGSYPVFFPGNGTSEPLTTFAGNEFPDPLQACPGYSVPTGLPVFVEIGGNVATSAGPGHSFTGNGTPLDHCVIDSNSPSVGSNLTYRGGVIVIPRQPLQSGVKYVVSLTVNGWPYTWSFTVGSLTNALSCKSVSATTAPPSPLQSGKAVTITATSTNCPNPRYRFWVSPPGQGWSVVQDYSASNTFVWTSTTIGGTYRLEVDARDSTAYASYDVVTNFTYTLTSGVCGVPTLSAGSASSPTGGTASFNAAASGCPAPNYRFWVGQSGAWKILQDYSASATFNWNTTGYAPGQYGIEVDVRDASSSAAYDHVANVNYSLAGCTAARLTTDLASPQIPGVSVVLSGSATCPGVPDYRFWVGQKGTWTIVQDFSPASTFTWGTLGKMQGTYGLEVDVRDHGSGASYESVSNLTYVLVNPCLAANLIPTSASSPTGGTATFTASTAGCPSPTYRFWVGQGGVWKILQDYSASATFNWNTIGYAPGRYGVEVDVRDASSSAAYDHVANVNYSLAGCTAARLTTDLASPQIPGVSVVLSGSATCPGVPDYRFWVGQNGTWTIVQDFSPASTFTWGTLGKMQGTYGLEVDVRDHGSGAIYESVANLTYVLSLTPCSAGRLTTDIPSPQTPGTTILLTGSATCAGTPEYRFWVRDLSGRWTIVRDYSSASTFTWNTAGLAPGTYGIEVDVRNQGATVVYETVGNLTYPLS